jgi:hypothetical protein
LGAVSGAFLEKNPKLDASKVKSETGLPQTALSLPLSGTIRRAQNP